MKIAFILEVFPSLSQTFVLNQITGLIDRGHEVDIYAELRGDSHKIHSDVETYRLLDRTYYQPQTPLPRLQRLWQGLLLFLRYFLTDPGLILAAVNVFRHGKAAASLRLLHAAIPFAGRRPHYDVILCHFGLLGLNGMALRQIGALEGRLVTVFHGVDMSQNLQLMGEDLYGPLFAAGDAFLPISDYWKDRLTVLGCAPRKITVHRMGIDPDRFGFRPRQRLDQETPRLISVSRLAEKKGLEFGIRAVAQLLQEGVDLEYIIIGDGDRKSALTDLIQELQVGHAIRLLGPRNHTEVLRQLEQSHILLAPSVTARDGNQEGIPVVLMEAMAMGLPVVSTYHTGIPELVEDGVSGFLVAERDVDGLAARLRQLLLHPESWAAMGAAGRRRVEQQHNIHTLNDQLVHLFARLIEEPSSTTVEQPAIASYSTPARP